MLHRECLATEKPKKVESSENALKIAYAENHFSPSNWTQL